jgi:hypothetical protein
MKQWDGIWKNLSPFIKRRGPDGAIHEGWCSIFTHEGCSCDDDDDDNDDNGDGRDGAADQSCHCRQSWKTREEEETPWQLKSRRESAQQTPTTRTLRRYERKVFVRSR